jgi:phytoene dehydrogenase-like protein
VAGGRDRIAIVGAGIAGLCAGCYAQMNGYESQVFELHDQPGGLCTAWDRRGYTVDFCIHWLVGSAPHSSFYRLWEEVGLVQGREFLNLDEFARFEDREGRALTFYTNLDRLEQHLLDLSPNDGPLVREYLRDVRRLCGHDMPADLPPRRLMSIWDGVRSIPAMLPFMAPMRKWSKITLSEFADRFEDPLLRDAFRLVWDPDSSTFFLMMTQAWMHDGVAGYPLGGSLPMAKALEKRYLGLGGRVEYKTRVEEILIEAGRAVGLRLAGGREERAAAVIWAGDGHAAIFDLLGGRYLDDTIRGYYRDFKPFPSLVFLGIGVARDFAEESRIISGISLPLDPPLVFGPDTHERLSVRIHNYDPLLAPGGKTVLTVLFPANFDYWSVLRADREAYRSKKDEVAEAVVRVLDARYPGLAQQVEMVDVATPATIERYTANWRGSFEGWLPTPENMISEMRRTLPGLTGFYLAGQWVMPGGGLPSGVKTGREVIQLLCHDDNRTFRTSRP